MATRAQQVIQNLTSLGEDFMDPKSVIKPVIDKLKVIKFPNDKARHDWIARIKERFGQEVADLCDQYAGKEGGSYPDTMTTALKTLIDNINGVARGNPGF